MFPRKIVTILSAAAAVAGLTVAALKGDGNILGALGRPIVPGQVDVYFSPKGGCTEAIVRTLRGAKKSVHVQAYSFTNAPIAHALVEAHRRCLRVEIILDVSQVSDRYSAIDFTSHAGIPTWIDSLHAIAHNKVMIVDEETVITGSFNFTKAAEEKNAENVLIIRQTPALAAKYLANWRAHRGHSTGAGAATPRGFR